MFLQIHSLAAYFSGFEDWPDLQDYQGFLEAGSCTANARGLPVVIIAQDYDWQVLLDAYEPRTYFRGQLQTRRQNWHDFFQLIIWKRFPIIKAHLNGLHCQAILRRTDNGLSQRSPAENAYTLFDENGAIIVARERKLLEMVREHRWHELFWNHRAEVQAGLDCLIFGHSLLEKALNPYIGMTAHSLLLHLPGEVEQDPEFDYGVWVESQVSHCLQHEICSPRDLQPFPLLGMPGWDRNDYPGYYEQSEYFRPRRTLRS